MSQGRWFRFYDGALDDPKVQKLDPALFKAWVNLLCVASRNNGEIPAADAPFALRMSERDTAKVVEALINARLLDNGETLRPHKWAVRQYKSDGSTERVKRFRERHSNGACNVSETPDETGPDTDTETDIEKPDANASGKKKGGDDGSKRGTRLPANWAPSDDDSQFAQEQGLDPNTVAERFRDFWISKPGRDGCKLDWSATWRNWCRNDSGSHHRGFGQPRSNQARPGSLLAAAHAVLSATGEAKQRGS